MGTQKEAALAQLVAELEHAGVQRPAFGLAAGLPLRGRLDDEQHPGHRDAPRKGATILGQAPCDCPRRSFAVRAGPSTLLRTWMGPASPHDRPARGAPRTVPAA